MVILLKKTVANKRMKLFFKISDLKDKLFFVWVEIPVHISENKKSAEFNRSLSSALLGRGVGRD